MAVPHDIDARRYYRVAMQRLIDGTQILDQLDRPNAAIYLTGYAVECILKALILMATPAQHRADVLQSFRGRVGHDLFWLRGRLGERHVAVPAAIAQALTYVGSWSVELRYEPGPGDREDAQSFIASAGMIVRWADGRM